MTSASTGDSSIPSAGARLARPSVFLMINNFEMGGSERQFVALAQSLDREKWNLHLGCIRRRGPLSEGLGDVPEFPLGGSLYGMHSLRTRLALRAHLKRAGIAVAHAFDFYANLTLVPAARLARIPVVVGSHRQLGDLLTPAQFRAQLASFRWCDAVVCNSKAAADRLAERGLPENKIRIIGNGLLLDQFASASAACSPHPMRVGMIARMNARYKNHELLLKAAARIAVRIPRVRFVLIGDGPLRPELEQKARDFEIADRVDFLGERQDIPSLLAQMDVSIVPSASESLSNVILESMAAGVPVVGSDVGGNRELLAQNRGILVPPDQDEALAHAIIVLLENPAQRAAIAAKAAQYVRAEYSLASIQEKYSALYRELLDRKLPASRARSSFIAPTTAGRLKVAIVAPTLRYVGGQAIQADLLLRQWHDDPDLAATFLPVDPAPPKFLAWVERIPGLRTLIREPIYLAHLWRDLRDVDIAHIFSASYSSFLLAPAPAWLIARLRGKKTLINYRSGEARDHLQQSAIARFILRHTDRLIVPSGYLIDVFREFGIEAHSVPNIVDLSQFQYRVRDPLRPHLVCTRGFHRYYCVDVVVKAFAEVQKEFPNAQLDLVGQGPLEAAIRKLVSDLNLRNVHFKGVASRQVIGSFYDAADIFINASYLDNMPVSVIEAFGAGTPVVTTSPESMRYLVDHERTGLLSQPGNASALAQNVLRLLHDPQLARQLAANAHKESERYRWQAVREQWLQIYQSLARTASTAPQKSTLRQHDAPE